jgi:hypothetical protein
MALVLAYNDLLRMIRTFIRNQGTLRCEPSRNDHCRQLLSCSRINCSGDAGGAHAPGCLPFFDEVHPKSQCVYVSYLPRHGYVARILNGTKNPYRSLVGT